MPLNEFQKNFKETMLRPLSQIDEAAPQFDTVFVSDHIPLNERLKIYHNNVLGSLAKNILATYPLLVALVSEDFLKKLAREFIMQNPPESACLHSYGESFGAFLKSHEAVKTLPYLADIATLEWALHKAYHAHDDKPMSAGDLAAIPPEDLADTKLLLRKSVSLISSQYPLQAIRDMCLNQSDNAPDMNKDYKTKLMVWRQNLEVNLLPLAGDEFAMLEAIQRGLPLGESVENTLESFPAFDVGVFLQKNLALETFSRLGPNN